MDIHIIRKGDADYPPLLASAARPPAQLYCRGNRALLSGHCFGVVGSRLISSYGRQTTADMAGALAAAGAVIVSGLAEGVDTAAHRAALEAGGPTVAVFGTGVDDASVFPSANLPLAQDILARGGLLISEYPAGTHGTKFTFPARNRIIAGLCRGLLVVEADLKSGSLITAKAAADMGRDVWAVPGSVYWPRSAGTNWLIAQGARPATCADDLLAFAGLTGTHTSAGVSTADPTQRAILAVLQTDGPTHVDALMVKCGLGAPEVMGAVAVLELQGGLTHMGAGVYRAT